MFYISVKQVVRKLTLEEKKIEIDVQWLKIKEKVKLLFVVIWVLGQIICLIEEIRKDNNQK